MDHSRLIQLLRKVAKSYEFEMINFKGGIMAGAKKIK